MAQAGKLIRMNFTIPKTFRLGGREWKVKRNVRTKKYYGLSEHTKCVIKLSTLNKSPEEEMHTFLHEVLHAIAYTMGNNKLNKDESKIDGMASLLLQVFESACD